MALLKQISTGTSVAIEGEIVASGGGKQALELKAASLKVR